MAELWIADIITKIGPCMNMKSKWLIKAPDEAAAIERLRAGNSQLKIGDMFILKNSEIKIFPVIFPVDKDFVEV